MSISNNAIAARPPPPPDYPVPQGLKNVELPSQLREPGKHAPKTFKPLGFVIPEATPTPVPTGVFAAVPTDI